MATSNRALLERIGLDSLRRRYLAVFIFLSFILILAAVFGWRYVEQISHSQLRDIQARSSATDALDDIIVQLHTLETNLQRFITLPTDKNRKNINRSFHLFESAVKKLKNNTWIAQDDALKELVMALEQDHLKLYEQADNLVSVRIDERKWFPAMNIMQEKMLTHNMQFMSALDFMIQEAAEEIKNPQKLEVYDVLNQTRHTWIMMISEFRLFVANSFGVFSINPEQGMQSRRVNIELYSNRLGNLLAKLDKMRKAGKLDNLSSASLTQMRDWHNKWFDSYNEIVDSLSNELWRQDLVLLNERIDPLFDRIGQRASSLQLELAVASTKNITQLTDVARELSDFVIYLAIAVTSLGIIGYIVFHRTILRPIASFAQAIKSESVDQHLVKHGLLNSSAQEFKELVTAFEEMHEQIRTRQAHLDYMAYYDALTHLPNRVLLRDRLELAIARSQRDKKMVGLMFLDLDRFKQINDSLGHDIGDKMLRVVATRLKSCVRATDTVSRLGGDEFAIIVEGVEHADQIAAMARKILNAFVPPFRVEQHELHSSTSIGIALGPNDDMEVDTLIKDADIAMYHAKDLGRNNYKFYSSEMASLVAEHMAIENQLRHALDLNQFELRYQPIVDLQSGRIISTEALLRWRHPERGLITPDNFLSILEDSGLIRPVTQWVLEEASKQYLRYKQAGHPNVRMAVNLSGLLLKGDSILDLVINTLEHTRMDPNGLIVEITEDTLVEDLHESDRALRTLKDMGIHVALDDFGTGQSSLSHLRLTPIDIVKIDRDFVRDIPDDQNDSDLVDAVIAMAHKLRMRVVAEGVETKQQLEFLQWHKCDCIQGYYYNKPLEADDMLALICDDKQANMTLKSFKF